MTKDDRNQSDRQTAEIDEEWAESGRMLSRLVRQLTFSLLFGYTGIPALWRSTKFYGVFMLLLFALSLALTLTLGWWYLFLVTGLFWFVDVATMASRIEVYARAFRHRKKHNSE